MKVIDNNPLFQLQYLAFNRAVLPSGSSVEDFAKYCKFVLCKKYKLPFKYSVMDDYTQEELIIEYFSHIYSDDSDSRTAFESHLIKLKLIRPRATTHDWLEEMVDKENKNINENFETTSEPIKYTPGDS